MFKLVIHSEKNNLKFNIHIEADKEIIKELQSTLKIESKNETHIDFDYNALSQLIGKTSKAQLIYDYIVKQKFDLDPRTHYLLEYWVYEMQMIKANRGYRCIFPTPELTNPYKLNLILDECKNRKISLSYDLLFNFLENLEYKDSLRDTQPREPSSLEIQCFLNNLQLTTISLIDKNSETFFNRPQKKPLMHEENLSLLEKKPF